MKKSELTSLIKEVLLKEATEYLTPVEMKEWLESMFKACKIDYKFNGRQLTLKDDIHTIKLSIDYGIKKYQKNKNK